MRWSSTGLVPCFIFLKLHASMVVQSTSFESIPFSFTLKILGSSPILSALAHQWSFAGAPVFVFHDKIKVLLRLKFFWINIKILLQTKAGLRQFYIPQNRKILLGFLNFHVLQLIHMFWYNSHLWVFPKHTCVSNFIIISKHIFGRNSCWIPNLSRRKPTSMVDLKSLLTT